MSGVKTSKVPCYVVTGALILGIVLELIGGITSSGMESVGFNTNLPAIMIVGLVLIVASFIAHIVLKCCQKRLNLDPVLLDAEAIIAIVAIFFGIVYLACVIVWPVLFPTNG